MENGSDAVFESGTSHNGELLCYVRPLLYSRANIAVQMHILHGIDAEARSDANGIAITGNNACDARVIVCVSCDA